MNAPYDLGPMPTDRRMTTIDERLVRAPLAVIFDLAADVERWTAHLSESCIDRLIELALRGGGPDNITCIVADVVDVGDACHSSGRDSIAVDSLSARAWCHEGNGR